MDEREKRKNNKSWEMPKQNSTTKCGSETVTGNCYGIAQKLTLQRVTKRMKESVIPNRVHTRLLWQLFLSLL